MDFEAKGIVEATCSIICWVGKVVLTIGALIALGMVIHTHF